MEQKKVKLDFGNQLLQHWRIGEGEVFYLERRGANETVRRKAIEGSVGLGSRRAEGAKRKAELHVECVMSIWKLRMTLSRT